MKDSTLALMIFGGIGAVVGVLFLMNSGMLSVIPGIPPIGEDDNDVNLCSLLEWYNNLKGYNACEIDLGGDFVCTPDEIGCYDTDLPIDCGHPVVDVFEDQCEAVGGVTDCSIHQLYCRYE